MAFGNDREWQQTVINYVFNYCEQVKADYKEFCKLKDSF
jgi:hypothetical protein